VIYWSTRNKKIVKNCKRHEGKAAETEKSSSGEHSIYGDHQKVPNRGSERAGGGWASRKRVRLIDGRGDIGSSSTTMPGVQEIDDDKIVKAFVTQNK